MFLFITSCDLLSSRRNGGGYWERGRRGTLTTYAADLINENHNNQYEVGDIRVSLVL